MAYAFQTFAVAFQFVQGTINLADTMRSETQTALAQLSGALDGSPGNPTLSQISDNLVANANRYLTTLSTATTWAQNNNALATSAAQLLGTTLATLNADVTALQNASTALKNADKTTVANAQAACNTFLAAVPALGGPFG